MMTRSQAEKSEIQQLHDSILALTSTIADLKATHDQRHDSYMQTFQLIQNQLVEHKNPPQNPPQNPPSHNHDTLKPPKLILPTFDGTNPLDWTF